MLIIEISTNGMLHIQTMKKHIHPINKTLQSCSYINMGGLQRRKTLNPTFPHSGKSDITCLEQHTR